MARVLEATTVPGTSVWLVLGGRDSSAVTPAVTGGTALLGGQPWIPGAPLKECWGLNRGARPRGEEGPHSVAHPALFTQAQPVLDAGSGL